MIELSEAKFTENRGELFRTLFADASIGCFFIDSLGSLEYINQTAADILGLNITGSVGEYTIIDVESVLMCGLNEVMTSIRDGQVFKLNEQRCTNRKGHFCVLNLFCNPYHKEDGAFEGFLGFIQDVTKWYRQKADLEKAVCELSIMREISEALSSVSDLEQVLKIILTGVTAHQGLGFNRAFLFLLDESEQNLEGAIALGPGSPEEAGRIWSRLAKKQDSLADLLSDYPENDPGGSASLTALIKEWIVPLKNPSIFSHAITNCTGLNVKSTDIFSTESDNIMNRLKTTNLAVAPIVSRGKCLGLIAADNQITGKITKDYDVQLLQTFAHQTAVAIERSKLHANLVEHATRLEDKNRQIAESQEQIVRIEKMSVIGELTSSIAHELRNPLTVIGGFANLMLNSNNSDGNNEYLNIIISEAKRAESVLHQVMDFSRASRTESGEIDINLLIKSTYDIFTARLKHNQKPPKLFQSEKKVIIWGNRDQIEHAFYQFISLTTEEFTGDCNPEIYIMADEEFVRMYIQFAGVKKIREKLKQTLSQIFGTSTGSQKLSIIVAGETIKYHGGSYGVEETPNCLPKIYIELPLKKGIGNG